MTGGENLGVKECICDSGGLRQKFEVKEVLSQVTTNSVIKKQTLFEESTSEVSAVSVPADTPSFHDHELSQDLDISIVWPHW